MVLNRRVLVLGGYTPSLINFRGPLLKSLCREGVSVVASAAEDDKFVAKQLDEYGVEFRPLRFSRTGLNPVTDLYYYYGLRRLIRNVKPDTILAYTHKPVLFGAMAAHMDPRIRMFGMITGLGYAFTGQGDMKSKLARRVISSLYALVSSRFETMFFQNEDDQALFQHEKIISQKQSTLVLPGSGVDLQHYREEPIDKPSGSVFLLVARLLVDKGIREYVEAAKKIKAQHSGSVFHLVGPTDTNPRAISEREVQAWHDEGIITYHGAVDDIRPLIKKCTVYVLPSYREGTPRTVLEAMAIGRAVITTNVAGCRQTVVDGTNGYLVPPRDVNALVETMERFIGNPDLVVSMGRAGRQMAEIKYDVNVVNSSILNALEIF